MARKQTKISRRLKKTKQGTQKKASNSIPKEVTDSEENKKISKSDCVVEAAADVESDMRNVGEEAGQLSDAGQKLKKKKKKSKKEMHRIDSDISFSAPSLSKTNLSLAEKPTPAPMTPIAEADTPTPAPMTPKAESPKSTPETALKSKASPSEETPRLKKKKMKKSKGMASLQESTPDKVFEEPTWDSPLLPGEQELVLPNKSYKGPEKLAPPAVAPEISGFEPSQITPVKSFTSTFLKKAVSKSGTPKKSKKEKLLEESAKKELSNSFLADSSSSFSFLLFFGVPDFDTAFLRNVEVKLLTGVICDGSNPEISGAAAGGASFSGPL